MTWKHTIVMPHGLGLTDDGVLAADAGKAQQERRDWHATAMLRTPLYQAITIAVGVVTFAAYDVDALV
jgi:hypothetical protein